MLPTSYLKVCSLDGSIMHMDRSYFNMYHQIVPVTPCIPYHQESAPTESESYAEIGNFAFTLQKLIRLQKSSICIK